MIFCILFNFFCALACSLPLCAMDSSPADMRMQIAVLQSIQNANTRAVAQQVIHRQQQEQHAQANNAYFNNPLVNPLVHYQSAHLENRLQAHAANKQLEHANAKSKISRGQLNEYEDTYARGDIQALEQRLDAFKQKLWSTVDTNSRRIINAEIAALEAVIDQPNIDIAVLIQSVSLDKAEAIVALYNRRSIIPTGQVPLWSGAQAALEQRYDYQEKMATQFKARCTTLHKEGDIGVLEQRYMVLQSALAKCTTDKMERLLKLQFEDIHKRLHDPMTQALLKIKTKDLATAKAIYVQLLEDDKHKPLTTKFGAPLKIGHKLDYIHNYGFDHLQAAKSILEARTDYQAELAAPQTTANMPTVISISPLQQAMLGLIPTTPIVPICSPSMQEVVDTAVQALSTTHALSDPMLYVQALETVCTRIHEMQCQSQGAHGHKARNTPLHTKLTYSTVNNFIPKDMQPIHMIAHTFSERIMVHDEPGYILQVAEACFQTLADLHSFNKQLGQNPHIREQIDVNSPIFTFAQLISKQDIRAACEMVASLSDIQQIECVRALLADTISLSVAWRGLGSTNRLMHTVTQLHATAAPTSSVGSFALPFITTNLPATGANTSSASSFMPDTTPIIFDPEQNVLIDHLVLDMVITSPTQLPIGPEARSLVNSKLAELTDKYLADDALLYLETLANALKGIPEMGAGQIALSLLQALQTKGYVELSDFTPHQQCALYFAYGVVEQVTDIKGLMHVNPKLLQLMIEWKIVTSTCGLINAQVMQNLGLDSELLKLENAIQGINPEKIKKVFQHIASMSPQEKSRVLGNITGAFLQAEIITAAMPTALKGIEKITQVVAESRVGQSVAQSVEKLEKFAQSAARIGTAEEVIAVTAEGVPVRVATAAQETVSFRDAAQKVGGAAQKAEGLLVSVAEQAVVKNLADSFVATARQDIPRLRQLFDGKFKGFGDFANKFLKFDYEHILGMELEFTRRGVPKIKGFHHDFMGTVEKSGVLEFANKKILENGFYKAEVRCLGHKVKDVSFFPANWSREQVIDKIIEACKNFVKSGAEIPWEPGGKCSIKVLTNEGVEIQVFITKNGAITSAYPVL